MTSVDSMRRTIADEGVTTPAAQEAVLTLVGLVWLLGQDPDLQAMAEANDLEHFIEGCKGPMFEQKLGRAMIAFREATAA